MTRNLQDLHLFSYSGSKFAFDPVRVRVIRLDSVQAFDSPDQEDEEDQARILTTESSDASASGLPPFENGATNGAFEEAGVQPVCRKVEILVNVTTECNLACRYCFVGGGRFHHEDIGPRRLSPTAIERFVKLLPGAFLWAEEICIHFYGGEPLLNLNAIVSAVRASEAQGGRISFAITTNGTVIDDAVFSILREGHFSVILSIDGPAHIHDELRRTRGDDPTHQRVRLFLDRLKSDGIFVRGSSVVRRGWSLGSASAYLKSLPVDAIKAQAVRLPEGNPISLSDEERKQYFRDLDALADEIIDGVRQGIPPKDDRFNSRVLQLIKGTRRDTFCGAGRSVFGLAADGTMLPCALMEGLEEMSLGDFSDPGEWVERGRKWAEGHEPRDECTRCWALPLCGGGCPVMLSACGEDECEMVLANCEAVLKIYAAFYDRPWDLLALVGVA